MSGGGGSDKLLATVAPMALMAIPGVGEALAPAMVGELGMGAGAANALSTGLMGALTSGGISAVTGAKNPLQSALIGGIGAGLGNYALAPGTAVGADGASSPLSDASADTSVQPPIPPSQDIYPDPTEEVSASATSPVKNSSSSLAGQVGSYAMAHPLGAAILGNSVLAAGQSLLPHKSVNVAQNAADTIATNPNFNASLPKYTVQNTGTPYVGDWYKYGQTPQTPMYNASLQPVAMKKGGQVHGYAAGGPTMPAPASAQMQPTQPINPLALQTAHNVGVAIGKHLKKQSPLFTGHGQVAGQGGGQDDAVPAKLSQDEYVIPADVVSHLGDGSSNAGGKALDHLVSHVRKQKAVKGFPPKAKNPLSYIKGA